MVIIYLTGNKGTEGIFGSGIIEGESERELGDMAAYHSLARMQAMYPEARIIAVNNPEELEERTKDISIEEWQNVIIAGHGRPGAFSPYGANFSIPEESLSNMVTSLPLHLIDSIEIQSCHSGTKYIDSKTNEQKPALVEVVSESVEKTLTEFGIEKNIKIIGHPGTFVLSVDQMVYLDEQRMEDFDKRAHEVAVENGLYDIFPKTHQTIIESFSMNLETFQKDKNKLDEFYMDSTGYLGQEMQDIGKAITTMALNEKFGVPAEPITLEVSTVGLFEEVSTSKKKSPSKIFDKENSNYPQELSQTFQTSSQSSDQSSDLELTDLNNTAGDNPFHTLVRLCLSQNLDKTTVEQLIKELVEQNGINGMLVENNANLTPAELASETLPAQLATVFNNYEFQAQSIDNSNLNI